MNYWHPVTNSCSSSPTQWPQRSPVRNIAEEKHVLHTCHINIPICKENYKSKFISVAHLLNNYFVNYTYSTSSHSWHDANDMYLSVYDLDVSNPIVVPVSLRLRLWRVIQNAHSRYALNQYCNVFFGENFHPILIIILVISVGVNLCISV